MKHEPRWPVFIAVLSCAALNWLLPASMSAGPGHWIVAATFVLGLGTLLTVTYGPEWVHLSLAYAMHGVVTIALAVALGKLITSLVTKQGRAEEVLASAGAIWGMNVLVFASGYWRIDGGGPKGRRLHKSYKEGAFLFPQATMSEEAKKMMNVGNWHPHFIDY